MQPHGPYLLGGFSGGGITAYEMARQLEAAGERGRRCSSCSTRRCRCGPMLSRRDRALIKWQQLRSESGYFADWARDRLAWELGRLRAAPSTRPTAPPRRTSSTTRRSRRPSAAPLPLYELQPLGRAARAVPARRSTAGGRCRGGRWVDSEREYVFEDNDWTRWAPATRVFEVPGDHDSMVLEPNVRVLAARMRACIEEAERGAAAGRPLPFATAAE